MKELKAEVSSVSPSLEHSELKCSSKRQLSKSFTVVNSTFKNLFDKTKFLDVDIVK